MLIDYYFLLYYNKGGFHHLMQEGLIPPEIY